MSEEYFRTWGASVPLTGWVLHSPYPGKRWRGAEKCAGVSSVLVFDSPQAAIGYGKALGHEHMVSVKISIWVPEVGAALHAEDLEMADFSIQHNAKLEARKPDFGGAAKEVMEAAADWCRENVVKPFCLKYGLAFTTGGEAWALTRGNQLIYDGVWPARQWERDKFGEEVPVDFPEGWAKAYEEFEAAIEEKILGEPLYWHIGSVPYAG